jgi:hypothetical protein
MCPVSAVLGAKIVVGRSVAIEQNWVLFRGQVACSSAAGDFTAARAVRRNESTRYVHRPIDSWYGSAGFGRLGGSRCASKGSALKKAIYVVGLVVLGGVLIIQSFWG